MKNIIAQLVQNLEPVIAIYILLLLIANCVLLVILPEMLDKVVTGLLIAINILILLFWLDIFHDQRKP